MDYSDVMADIIMGYQCNARCDYCTISEVMRGKNLTTKQVIEKLKYARSLGIHKISFGGGEPTIRRDLLPLIKLCKSMGFDYIKVASNGLMYSYHDFATSMVKSGVTQFNITIKTYKPHLYDKIIGRKGAFRQVVKGIENLINLGQNPVLDLIIKNDTYSHLAETVRYYAELGAKNFVLWLVSLTDANSENFESLPRVSKMRKKIFRAFDYSKAHDLTTFSRHIPKCMLKGYEDFVWKLREDRVLVVTPDDMFFLWDSVISANTYTEKCKGCMYYMKDCMGVRADYLKRFGDSEISPYYP